MSRTKMLNPTVEGEEEDTDYVRVIAVLSVILDHKRKMFRVPAQDLQKAIIVSDAATIDDIRKIMDVVKDHTRPCEHCHGSGAIIFDGK